LPQKRSRPTRARSSRPRPDRPYTTHTARAPRRRSWLKPALWVLGGGLALFVLIQFIPYGHSLTGAAAANPFKWSSPKAEAIAKAACYDCHSDETKSWWAVRIAPFSWLAQHDATKGRARLNFSDWTGALSAQELQRAIDGNMPPLPYRLMHPGARLTDAQEQELIAGFQASLAQNQGSSVGAGSGSGSSSGASGGSGSSGGASAAVALLNARCGTCHQAPVGMRIADPSQAQAMIDQMVQQGAVVSPSEEQTLIDYFTR
jgi:uncharacterized membrane protein YgcG